MELLKYMAGIDIQHVPYRGTAAAVTDVVSGQIAVALATALTAKPQVDAGRVRALAVSGPRRVEALPNVPPVADAVPGYEAMQWYGLLGPAGVPNAIVEKLNAEALVALRSKQMKDRLAADGAETVLHLLRAQRNERFGVQLFDDRVRHAGGREQAVPLHRLVARHRIRHWRHARQGLDAARPGNRQRAHASDLRLRRERGGKGELD